MKHDETKVLKAPADMDTGAVTHHAPSHYYTIIHKEMEDVLKKKSEDPRPAIKKLCSVVAQQLDDMVKDRETEKKLAKKDSEILKHSIINEITKVIDKKVGKLDAKIDAQGKDIRQMFRTAMYTMVATTMGLVALSVSILSYIK